MHDLISIKLLSSTTVIIFAIPLKKAFLLFCSPKLSQSHVGKNIQILLLLYLQRLLIHAVFLFVIKGMINFCYMLY